MMPEWSKLILDCRRTRVREEKSWGKGRRFLRGGS